MIDLPRQGKGGLTGKIARLPYLLRERLNHRLLNGQPAAVILPWLNGKAAVQEILAAQFAGAPINAQNLSHWRRTAYQQWLKDNAPILKIRNHSRYARKMSRADVGLIQGATAIAADKLLEFILSPAAENISLDDLVKLSNAIKPLINADHTRTRLKYGKTRLELEDERLTIFWDRLQRDQTAIAQRVLTDDHAKAIQASRLDNSLKIELLGSRMFGKFWQMRKRMEQPGAPATNPPPPPSSPT